MNQPTTPPTRRKRDPESRRKEIVDAAVAVLVDGGDFTHRVVAQQAGVSPGSTTYYFASLHELRAAAITQLSEEATTGLQELAVTMHSAEGDPQRLAEALHDYLSDQKQLQIDAALYGAALRHPDLREIALEWTDGFVHLASEWTDAATARSLAVFIDGATIHSALAGAALDLTILEQTLSALLRQEEEQA